MARRRPTFTKRLFVRPGELIGWVLNRPSPRRVKVATSLRFLHEVLGLDRLHYGLWNGDEMSIEGLKSAQKRYSELIHSWIPDSVHSILDVGAGVGTDARDLSASGYEVEGLAPDPYQQARFVERTGLPFHLSRFQDFEVDRTYDLVLMSESAQYIWLESLFERTRVLAPGGYLLVADYFLIGGTGKRIHKTTHPLPSFLEGASAAGFRVERQKDITEQVLPTLELARMWVERYAEPTLGIVSSSIARRRPHLHRLVWPRVDRAVQESLLSRSEFDTRDFARTKRYELLLLRVPA